MELVDGDAKSPTLISNVEVMELLKKNIEEREEKDKKRNKNRKNNNRRNDARFRHRDWVEGEVYRYLQGTPCVKLDPDKREEFHSKLKGNKKLRRTTTTSATVDTITSAGTSAMDIEENNEKQPSVTEATAETTGFDLTEAEALQIMNMMPTEPVEIHLMIDDLQSRMSEERQEEFLAFVGAYSTGATPAAAAAAAHQQQHQQPQPPPPTTAIDSNHNNKVNNGAGGGRRHENGTKPAAGTVRVKQEAKGSAVI